MDLYIIYDRYIMYILAKMIPARQQISLSQLSMVQRFRYRQSSAGVQNINETKNCFTPSWIRGNGL